MLTTYPGGNPSAPIDPHKTWWVDLANPTDEEKAAAERMCRFRIPSRQELSEIETSSRISGHSLPEHADCLHRGRGGGPAIASRFRFVEGHLVTVRYTELRSFNAVAATFSKPEAPRSAVETFGALADAMVDLCADTLEAIQRRA